MIVRPLLLIIGCSSISQAYPWPVAPFHGPGTIIGTLGEYRDTAIPDCPNGCAHFHDGTDISGVNTEVRPVANSVLAANPAGNTVNAGTFIYVHLVVNDALRAGDPIVASVTRLGDTDAQNHVHLIEVNQAGAELNALRAGGLDQFVDGQAPVINRVRLFPHDGNRDEPLGPDLGDVRFNVQAYLQDRITNGSQNSAAYRVGYRIYNVDTGQIVPGFDRFPTQEYSQLSGADDVQVAYDTFFSQGGLFGGGNYAFYYLANNTKNNAGTAAAPINTANMDNGNYNVCVIAADISGNQTAVDQEGDACIGFPTQDLLFVVERRRALIGQNAVGGSLKLAGGRLLRTELIELLRPQGRIAQSIARL